MGSKQQSRKALKKARLRSIEITSIAYEVDPGAEIIDHTIKFSFHNKSKKTLYINVHEVI